MLIIISSRFRSCFLIVSLTQRYKIHEVQLRDKSLHRKWFQHFIKNYSNIRNFLRIFIQCLVTSKANTKPEMIYTHLLYSSEHNRIISIRLTCNWKILLKVFFLRFVHQKIVVRFKENGNLTMQCENKSWKRQKGTSDHKLHCELLSAYDS